MPRGAHPDFKKIADYFGERLDRFGAGISALDYGSRESQLARFDVLYDACGYHDKCVLDVGCGLGDFGVLLRERVPSARYTGVDICEGMVHGARERGLDVRLANILIDAISPEPDVIIANGIFYLLEDGPEQKMQALIAQMFELAGEMVVFTSLSAWHDPGDGDESVEDSEFRADPLRVLEFCRKLTSAVCLRHDYLPHDFCVSLRK